MVATELLCSNCFESRIDDWSRNAIYASDRQVLFGVAKLRTVRSEWDATISRHAATAIADPILPHTSIKETSYPQKRTGT